MIKEPILNQEISLIQDRFKFELFLEGQEVGESKGGSQRF